MVFEAQNYTPDTLRDATVDLAVQGQYEGYSTKEMIERLSSDQQLNSDELVAISREIQYDVVDVCNNSHQLCEELKDQIFINRLKSGIPLSVNGNGVIMDEGLFQKHFGINIVQILEDNNGGLLSRTIGNNSLEMGDIFTIVLEGEKLTFFNGENKAEFSYNIKSGEISRKNLGENNTNDDTSILDIDMEVDRVIEGGLRIFHGSAREALLNPQIRKDLRQLTHQDIVTFSEQIGMDEHFLQSLQSGDRIVAHGIRSDEDMTKIAGLLSIQDPQRFVSFYRDKVNSGIPSSILITHDENNVYLTDEKRIPYSVFPRN